MTFNILTEPWIPMSSGETLSLLDALAGAQALAGVECVSPLETVAVYRLMIAFLMDALQLKTRDERLALLRQGRFDVAAIHAYARRCEAEGASFDLFDAERPFMQAAYDQKLDKERKSAAIMALEIPSGNNHVFFDHAPEARFTPGEALRQLLTAYLFCTAAAQGYPSSVNNTPCVYVLHHGENLHETLTLNMVSRAECGNIAWGKPAWREDGKVEPKREFADVSMLRALTWQPRRATLLADEGGIVSEVYWQQGHNFKGNALWRDPHVPYRILKGGEYTSLKPQSGRAFWRDLGALAASREDRYGKPPLVVANAPEDKTLYRLSMTGLVTSNASLIDLDAEEMNLPRSVLEDAERGDMLREDLLFFEDCAQALRFAAKDLQGGALVPILQDAFFAMTRDYIYGEYLEQLDRCDGDELFVELRGAVHERALKMLLTALDREKLRLGSDGKMLKVQAEMRKKTLAIYYKRRRERENAWQ